MTLFECTGISKQFSTQFVLNNFDFSVAAGDKWDIRGASGIGKTTLFKLLLGFIQPESGSIHYKGKALTSKQVWQVRKDVAYVSQDAHIGHGLVNELFIETAGYKNNHSRYQTREQLAMHLDFFELNPGILNKPLEQLSGGEKQRIALINALMLNRTIFFLDEMTSALDGRMKIRTRDLFFTQNDWTVLSISHDLHSTTYQNTQTLTLGK